MSTVRELPQDQTMPHMGTALDPIMMAAYFQTYLIESQATAGVEANNTSLGASNCVTSSRVTSSRVTNCQINHVKYRAGKKCVIGYIATLFDEVDGAQTEHHYAARIFPTNTSLARYQKAQKQPLVMPKIGSPLIHIPELEMVIWAFPNDRKLFGMAQLLATASHANRQLDQMISHAVGVGWQIEESEHRLIHYVPEHTCTTRVDLALRQTATGSRQQLSLFGKAYYNDDGLETRRMMEALWGHTATPTGNNCVGLRVARPLVYDAESRVLWQAGLAGQTMLSYEGNQPFFSELAAEAATAVALLHSSNLPCTRISQRATWIEQLRAVQRLINSVQPHLSQRVTQLVDTLIADAGRLPQEPTATLHGDLHWQNFLVDEEQPAGQRIALIDLDNLSSGSPWMDLGSLFAGLIYRALLNDGDGRDVRLAQVQKLSDIFLANYQKTASSLHSGQTTGSQSIGRQSTGSQSADHRAIAWYTAAALINERVYRSISRLKPGRMALIEDLLDAAEGLYGQRA